MKPEKEEGIMPVYSFHCRDCKEEVTLKLSLKDWEAKDYKCPQCGGKNLDPVFSGFYAKTSKKS